MPLFIFFVLWLVLELMVLSAAVDLFGLLLTLLWIVLSAALGVALLRGEQLKMLLKLQQAQAGLQQNIAQSSGGIYRVLAGLLLLFPGLISDILALTLLITPLRQLFGLALLRAFKPERVMRGFRFHTKADASYEYDGEVQARRADGSRVQAEILDAPPSQK